MGGEDMRLRELVTEGSGNFYDDPLYWMCLSMARFTRAGEFRNGSLFVTEDGLLAGLGFTHRVGKNPNPMDGYFVKEEPDWQGDTVPTGYSVHGETDSAKTARRNGYSGRGSVIASSFMVNGNERRIYVPERTIFTCEQCPSYLKRLGADGIYVPFDCNGNSGWSFMTLEEAASISAEIHGKYSHFRDGRATLGKRDRSPDDFPALPAELLKDLIGERIDTIREGIYSEYGRR